MGMFTTIIHPVTGEDVQIKCGYDDLETYHVGDTVNWFIDKDWPKYGKLLDDVYLGYNKAYDDTWVIIKDHIVLAVSDRNFNDEEETYENLKTRYNIQEVPDNEWSEEVWAKYVDLKNKSDEKYQKYLESISHLSGNARLAAILTYPLRERLNYESVARKCFTINQIEDK